VRNVGGVTEAVEVLVVATIVAVVSAAKAEPRGRETLRASGPGAFGGQAPAGRGPRPGRERKPAPRAGGGLRPGPRRNLAHQQKRSVPISSHAAELQDWQLVTCEVPIALRGVLLAWR
jgi:hypothetical protein